MPVAFRRRQVLILTGAATVGTICATFAAFGRGESEADRLRGNIYAQIDAAGWARERPEIYQSSEHADELITGALPVAGGCGVRLAFSRQNPRVYRVRYYLAKGWDKPGNEDYILRATGRDGRTYPDVLQTMQNPTRQQLDTMLTRAGMNSCEPISG